MFLCHSHVTNVYLSFKIQLKHHFLFDSFFSPVRIAFTILLLESFVLVEISIFPNAIANSSLCASLGYGLHEDLVLIIFNFESPELSIVPGTYFPNKNLYVKTSLSQYVDFC